MYQIKISLPNYSTTINVGPELTSLNLIELILDKYECPRCYSQVCVILVYNESHNHVLSYGQTVQQFFNQNNKNQKYFFRVMFVPENQDIQKLHINFQKILYEQIQYYVTQGIYNITFNPAAKLIEYPPIMLAGYVCAISHGRKARRHNKRFLMKIIDKILPANIFTFYGPDTLCEAVLEVWSQVPIYQNVTKNDYIFQYLCIAQASVKQFGSFIIIANQQDKTQASSYIYINKENMGVYYEDRLYYDSYKDMFIDCDDGEIKVVYHDKYFKFYTSMNVQQIQRLISRNQFYQSGHFKVDANGFLPLQMSYSPQIL